MNPNEEYYRQRVDDARKRYAVAQKALAKVHSLLAKADEEYRREPRKWHHVVDNLEASLDTAKGRVTAAGIELQRFEEKLVELLAQDEASAKDSMPMPRRDHEVDIDSPWPPPMNLDEASRLRDTIDQDAERDKTLEARLELSNQLGETYACDASGKVPQRQLALRAAIDKIIQQRIDAMTYGEVRLVLACQTLLDSRLEPRDSDKRIKRIIDEAGGALHARKEAIERQARAVQPDTDSDDAG